MRVRFAPVAVLMATCLGLVGCGGGAGSAAPEKTVRVSGTVTYQGRPVVDAAIAFVPDAPTGRGAFGRTDSAGKYQLMTFAPGDGAVPGSYKVTVAKQVVEPPAKTAETGANEYVDPESAPTTAKPAAPIGMLPVKYSAASSTPLTASIADGSPQELPFELKD